MKSIARSLAAIAVLPAGTLETTEAELMATVASAYMTMDGGTRADQYIDAALRHDWRFAPLEAEVDGTAPAFVLHDPEGRAERSLSFPRPETPQVLAFVRGLAGD